MTKSRRMSAIFVILSCALFLMSSSIYADEDYLGSFNVQDGFYLEFFGIRNSIGGDFDDTSYLYRWDTIYDVPKVDAGYGFGASLGLRTDNAAFEVSYQRSTHDTFSSFTEIGEQEASLSILDFNAKFDIFEKDRVRPYLLVGLGLPWLTIPDSMIDTTYNDETFYGISGNLGVGLAYYFNPKVCITGGMIYRWLYFTSVEGVSIHDELSAGGPCFRLGIAFTF